MGAKQTLICKGTAEIGEMLVEKASGVRRQKLGRAKEEAGRGLME